ncbi:MAG: hypothetical protein NDI60_11630 [Elusimicrobiales bacterium]|nr:hypothetical protein [Elusimicrobiales bacterium]
MTKRITAIFLTVTLFSLPLTAAAGQNLESSREVSGKNFLEIQNKPGEVKLDCAIAPAKSAPLKLSAPAKARPLASQVKTLPQDDDGLAAEIQAAKDRAFKVLDLGMTLTITGIGVVFGGLAGGVPGAVIGGGIAYGAWTAAKLTA